MRLSSLASARAAAAVIAVVMAFQLALVLGAPWGDFTQGGAYSGTLPAVGRVVAGISFLLLGLMAVSLLARAGEGPLRSAPRVMVAILGWLAVVYLALAIVVNLATPSMGERLIWAPVSAVAFVLALLTMLRTRAVHA
ncbi:MAG: hypothetical protein Q8M17_16895 [Actinomycetota bacterium]|nr:hypothetical protein [Actinomycetota bacterium]